MNRETNSSILSSGSRQKLLLAAAAFLAPFYFVFPGTVYERVTSAERRLIWICMAAGLICYITAITLVVR